MAKVVVGLDVGSTAIKAALFQSTLRGMEFREFRSRPLPPAGPAWADAVAAALKDLFSEGERAEGTFIAALPGDQTSFHILTLPYSDRRQIDQVVPAAAEEELPFSLEEVVVGWMPLAKAGEGTRILAVAARREDVKGFLDLLARGGIDPEVVEVEPLALLRLAHGLEVPGEAHWALLDLGGARANLLLLAGQEVTGVRTLPAGTGRFLGALARRLGLPLEEAERVLRNGKEPRAPGERKKEEEAFGEAALEVAREVRHTLYSSESRGKPDLERVVVAGGGSLLKGPVEALGRALGVELEELSLGRSFPVEVRWNPGEDRAFATAFGLALRAVSAGAEGVDLRVGEFAYRRGAEEIRAHARHLGKWAALVGGFWVLSLAWSATKASSLSKSLFSQMRKIASDSFPELADSLDPHEDMSNAYRALKGRVAVRGGANSAIDVLREVSAGVPSDLRVDVQEIIVEMGRVRVKAQSDSIESIDKVVQALKKGKGFTEVTSTDVRVALDGKSYDFQLLISLEGGGGE